MVERSASITHRIPGRLRIRIPSAKGDREFLRQSCTALAALPGVIEVTCSPLTGSLLVLHAPQVELEQSLNLANGKALPFVLGPAAAPQAHRQHHRNRRPRQSILAQALGDAIADIDDNVLEATGNSVDLKVLLPIGAAFLGFSMFGKNRVAPAWLTLLMFAFSAFLSLHAQQNEPAADGIAEAADGSNSEE